MFRENGSKHALLLLAAAQVAEQEKKRQKAAKEAAEEECSRQQRSVRHEPLASSGRLPISKLSGDADIAKIVNRP